MKKYSKEIVMFVLFVLACVVLFLFDGVFTLLPDRTADDLLQWSIARIAAFCLLLPMLFFCGFRRSLVRRVPPRALLWCIPCLLVAVVNFPVVALATGGAKIDRVDLIWLFAVYCISIGLMEELLFRGILQQLLFDYFKKRGLTVAILVNSAIFGLWHLTNLFAGASFGATALQVGYSFLIGAMLSAVLHKTGNLWICVFLHALFDFGGMLVEFLGSGTFQDVAFWVLTAVFGALCFAHVLLYVLRCDRRAGVFRGKQKKPDETDGQKNREE